MSCNTAAVVRLYQLGGTRGMGKLQCLSLPVSMRMPWMEYAVAGILDDKPAMLFNGLASIVDASCSISSCSIAGV
jgi:hypothetical protein